MKYPQNREYIADRYQVIADPIEGSKGLVYFCIDQEINHPLVLKEIMEDYIVNKDIFLDKINAWIDLGYHPNIVHCFNVINENSTYYLVLELITKEPRYKKTSLREWIIPGQKLEVEVAVLYGLQIARGMKYANLKKPGNIHGNLKPENILLGVDKLYGYDINRLRINNFGLALGLERNENGGLIKLDKGTENIYLNHSIRNTLLYWAPEHWEQGNLDVYTDIYALGCILYEMACGESLITGETIQQLQKECLNEKNLLKLKNYPTSLINFIENSVKSAPKERYKDWLWVEKELEQIYKKVSGKNAPLVENSKEQNRVEQVSLGYSFYMAGVSYFKKENIGTAAKYFEQALGFGDKFKDENLKIDSLNNLGIAYQELGEMQNAINCLERSLLISRSIGDRKGEGSALGNLGCVYDNLGMVKRAIKYYEKSQKIYLEMGDRFGEGASLGNLGLAYENLGEVKRAIKYYEQSLRIFKDLKDRKIEGITIGNLGGAYYSLGEIQRALCCYEQSLEIVREIGNRNGEGIALGNLGCVYFNLGEVQRAINYHEQSLVIARELNDRHGEGDTLGNLGNAYESLGQNNLAIWHHQQALIIEREIGDRRGESGSLGNLGKINGKLGDFKTALIYFLESMAIKREIEDDYGVAVNCILMADLYRQLGEVEKAIDLLQEAVKIWKDMGNKEKAKEAKVLLKEVQIS